MLYWPDTVLNFVYVGIADLKNADGALTVFQNHPNPVSHQTTVSIYSPADENIEIRVSDISGKTEIIKTWFLNEGCHDFVFTPGNSSLYFFTANSGDAKSSIKISNTSVTKKSCKINYHGYASHQIPEREFKNKNTSGFAFAPGDKLLLTACYDTLESGMFAYPEAIETYTFQFAYNIPCPGMPVINYQGKEYNTVQIFNQCWLKENLDVGEMIPSGQPMTNNALMEKYCYKNDPSNCEIYGGLYQWGELMQYASESGSRGICPPIGDWHVPTDEEWMILEGASDSQYSIGDSIWNTPYYRGFDTGKNLKSNAGWNNNINGIDRFGFKALPGGILLTGGVFNGLVYRGYWASSSEFMEFNCWHRYMAFDFDNIGSTDYDKTAGYSVRCLHN